MVCPMITCMQYWSSWITLFLMAQVPYYCYVVMSKMTWKTQALQLQVVKICHSFCTNLKLSNISTTIFNNNSKTRCCREGCWNSKSSLAPSPLLSPPLFTGQFYILYCIWCYDISFTYCVFINLKWKFQLRYVWLY